ncbi:MAG: RIP metalloprotease RseP [Gammaproteobacteria bacterium]|nr:MAG: RIP metalloprotease RseP [Gammaproteobacteria bacterium]
MLSALISLLAFIVAISVLVAIHEFGHYIVGRWCGMKVLRFSIGFGKPLWTRVAGEDKTEYCISAIPLGGYVKFLGEREDSDEPVDPADKGRAFNERPVLSRIAVSLAGPAFNFLFAFVAYWALFINGVPTMKPAVGVVTPASYAADAGLEFGDRILKVGDTEAADWETALVTLLDEILSDGRVEFELEGVDGWVRSTTIDVGDDASRLTEPGLLFEGLGFEPWQPPAVIETVGEDGAAHAGGIIEQDRITAIAGEDVKSFRDLQRIVSARPHEKVSIELVRNGEPQTLDLTIGSRDQDGVTSGFLDVGIGAAAQDYWYVRKYGPWTAIGESVQKTWASTGFTVRMLGRMITGEVSIKNISGPINIAQYAGSAAVAGLNAFLKLLAMISISLGVLNLLPIPVLDGGQIVYHVIEGLKGSPLSQHAQLIGQQVGVVALLLLMSFAFYNDIARILS